MVIRVVVAGEFCSEVIGTILSVAVITASWADAALTAFLSAY
jgi:hypothetical protein